MTERINEGIAYLSKLLKQNEEHIKTSQHLYGQLKASQNPKVAIAYCSDSRIQMTAFASNYDQALEMVGNVFTGEDIGHTYESISAMARYAVGHLRVGLIMVLGHTNCGAVAASCKDYSNEDKEIQLRLDSIHEPISAVYDPCLEESLCQALCAQQNVDHQVSHLVSEYDGHIADNKLVVFGAIQDISGAYGGPLARVYLTNINGETNSEKIMAMSKGFNIPPDILELKIKRLSKKK